MNEAFYLENAMALFNVRTLSALSSVVGVSRAHLSNVYTGKSRLGRPLFMRFLELKNLTPEQMFLELGMPNNYFEK